MKYQDGKTVMIGDIANLGPGAGHGRVVCIIEENQAENGYKIEDWAYLKKGVVFKSNVSGDVYFTVPDEDTILLRRKG